MKLQHLDLISMRTGNPEKLRFFDGVFWVAQGVDRSAGVWISARWFHEGDLDRAFDLLKAEVGTPIGFKAVGMSRLLTEIGVWLSINRYKLLNQAIREGTFEIQFFPKECKIHVTRKLKVLVVDDSKTIRNLLTKILSSDPGLDVVGAADRPSIALGLMRSLKPDVITLDLELPEMDGVTFLKDYLKTYSIPTVMISSISLEEGPKVLQALEAGAVDYIQKPSASELAEISPLLIEKVKSAGVARVKTSRMPSPVGVVQGVLDPRCLIAIGSSTGGTEALRVLLTQLPAAIPPILIAQHIPAVFSKAFADRMNSLCPFEVVEGADGMEVLPGKVYVAPGGKQMQIKKRADHRMFIGVNDSPAVNRHKPSVDYLFDSVVEACAGRCIGIILTGMGSDGANGLLKLKMAGARTIAQDEASCAVFGMPREAIRLEAAQEVLPIGEIPRKLMQWLSQRKAA